MRTKLFMILAIVLMGLSSTLQAQPGRGRKAPEFPSKQMIKELKLTDDQVANLKKGDTELRTQMQATWEKKDVSREEMREAMGKMIEARNEIVKKNLTPEQYTKYVELEKKNPRNGRGPQGGRPGGEGTQGGAPTE
jgi:Spy/CpxP family protein refolding chaperone